MAQSITITGKLTTPNEDGQVAGVMDLASTFVFTQKASFDRVYSALTTDDAVDFGTLETGGCKAILVKCSVGAATIKFNGATLAIALVPGAYFLYVNPSSGFVTSALISTTGAATLKIMAVG